MEIKFLRAMIKNKFLLSVGVIAALLIVILCFVSIFPRQRVSRLFYKKPNILLITACSLRQDHLGCYRYPRNTSPHIDRLANSSIRFENCHTHIPWTKPSTIALMTGKYPSPEVVIEKETALPALLRSAGYLTCGIIGTNVVRDGAKADVGFDTFLDNRDMKTSKDAHSVQADTVVDKAIEWLNKSMLKKKPLFLWVLFKDPHWPYLPPLGYQEKFSHDLFNGQPIQKLVINEDRNNSVGGVGEARLKNTNGDFINDKAYYLAQYDAEILFMDSQIGRIFEFLKQKGGYEDWAIVFMSDHGESMGENNYFFDHGYSLAEGTTRIPLIVKLPQQKKGESRNAPVSISDIYPTLMELARAPKERSPNNIYGISLLNGGRRWQERRSAERTLMLENSPGHETENMKIVGCIWRTYKLIHNMTTNEKTLYDISKKECLLEGSSPEEKKITDKMSGFIASFYNEPDSTNTVSREELKSLGYLQ